MVCNIDAFKSSKVISNRHHKAVVWHGLKINIPGFYSNRNYFFIVMFCLVSFLFSLKGNTEKEKKKEENLPCSLFLPVLYNEHFPYYSGWRVTNPRSLYANLKSDSGSSQPSALSNQTQIASIVHNESGCQAFQIVTALRL